EFKQAFVHEVQQHVLPADVDDKHNFWPKRCDIGEVLFRSHAKINAAWFDLLFQRRNHVLESTLIRDEIIGSEITAGFRKLRYESPKVRIRKSIGKFFSNTVFGGRSKQQC